MEAVNEIMDLFYQLKTVIDKYPNAITMSYAEGEGYLIDCDLGLIELHLEKVDSTALLSG